MRLFFPVILLGLFLLSFVSPPEQGMRGRHFAALQDDRDGSSYEKAIIIQDTTSMEGIKAEYKWLSEHYPGYKMKKQQLSQYQGRFYDIMHFKHKGKKKKIYFDITNFFGKW
ncbi:MAG: hypothetical protein AB1458_14160 [Bacteroidota bacterium]